MECKLNELNLIEIDLAWGAIYTIYTLTPLDPMDIPGGFLNPLYPSIPMLP